MRLNNQSGGGKQCKPTRCPVAYPREILKLTSSPSLSSYWFLNFRCFLRRATKLHKWGTLPRSLKSGDTCSMCPRDSYVHVFNHSNTFFFITAVLKEHELEIWVKIENKTEQYIEICVPREDSVKFCVGRG